MEKIPPLLLPITVFGVYLCTTAPVVYLGDSGELTVAAFSLGIPHPSGYPLYSLLGKIFCMIPFGNVGFRMNLMSAFFSALTVSLVYTIIFRITSSILSSAVAAVFLAFTPLFWSQTISAEVYPLHTFFVALMIRLLWWWDENKEYHRLLIFVFVTGLSFGNHMQTVMLAPAVLFLIISGDKRAIFNLRRLITISTLFILPLAIYLYLPIRTNAGVAIHWGDPDSIGRFLAHVTARAHRGSYVFSLGTMEYLARSVDALKVVFAQYGILLLLCSWGWLKLRSVRWKIFFAAMVLFDFVYTIFLNIISFEITPFTLPTSIAMAILLGVGINNVFSLIKRWKMIGSNMKKIAAAACCAIPVIPLIFNFGVCNQSRNYTAYEHTVNIFRTADLGSTIFLDGDNNLFPAAYGRIIEGIGEGITLYDVHNLIFRWSLEKYPVRFKGTWVEFESMILKTIMTERTKRVYFAVINPFAASVPTGYHSIPYGTLRRVVTDAYLPKKDNLGNIWDYYYTESFHDDFIRDYMTREVCSRYFYRYGESLLLTMQVAEGLKQLSIASKIGYDDTSIHSDIGVLLTDRGFFDEARNELEKALVYHDDLSRIYNNWGYYYHKKDNCEQAITSFRKALQLTPNNYTYHNNLGVILYKAGKKKEALLTFKKSLSINNDQPAIAELIKKYNHQ